MRRGMQWHERFMCWLEMKFESDDLDWNCQQLWKTTKPVCYECIHCRLFICCIVFHTCYICHAVLKFAVLLYKSYTFGVLKLIFCIQERHLGTLHFVFQDYGTRELTFSMFKSTFQVKKQCFAAITTYISSAKAIFVTEFCSCCYILNKLHITFKCEGYTWCISMQCLMHFASVLDKHPLSERLRLCFGEAKSEISRWVLIFQDELRHKSIHTKDTRHWKWWKLLLMPSNVCAIPEYPLLLALYLDTKRGLKKLFLEEIINLWL